jgi:glycosyltransferase involved in cell wall biosynthesis
MVCESSSPLVSIIVPTRNRPEALMSALHGVQAQSFGDYEVLVMDDGSEAAVTNRYAELLGRLDARFAVHQRDNPTPRGSGPSVIRNLGLSLARGKYIAFCDDDDQWTDPGFLEDAVGALEDSCADLLLGNQITVRKGETVKADWLPRLTAAAAPERRLPDREVYRLRRAEVLRRPGYGHLNFTVASRRLIEDVGAFWEGIAYTEDIDLFVRLVDRCNTVLYRPRPNACHHAPDGEVRSSASNRLSALDRRLIEALMYQHALTCCSSPEALSYLRAGALNTDKGIVQLLVADGHVEAAAVFARRGLAAQAGLKWAAYSAWLSLKAMWRKRSQATA